MDFDCIGCGLCCNNVKSVIDRSKGYEGEDPFLIEGSTFPYKVKKNGSCEMLDKDGKCKVYETRPDICSVDIMFEKHYKGKMSKKQWYKMNAKACNTLMEDNGLDKKNYINVNQYN